MYNNHVYCPINGKSEIVYFNINSNCYTNNKIVEYAIKSSKIQIESNQS